MAAYGFVTLTLWLATESLPTKPESFKLCWIDACDLAGLMKLLTRATELLAEPAPAAKLMDFGERAATLI